MVQEVTNVPMPEKEHVWWLFRNSTVTAFISDGGHTFSNHSCSTKVYSPHLKGFFLADSQKFSFYEAVFLSILTYQLNREVEYKIVFVFIKTNYFFY
jgi:hypothetical protein